MHIYTCRLGHRHDDFLKQLSSSSCALFTCPRLRLDLDTPALPPHTHYSTVLRCCRAHMGCGCPRFFVGVTCLISLRTSFPGRSSFPRTQTTFDYRTEKHTQQRSINACVSYYNSCNPALMRFLHERVKAAGSNTAGARLSQLTSYVRVGVDRLQHLQLLHAALLGGIGARGSEVRDAHERGFFIGISRCRRGSGAHMFPVAVLTASGGEA